MWPSKIVTYTAANAIVSRLSTGLLGIFACADDKCYLVPSVGPYTDGLRFRRCSNIFKLRHILIFARFLMCCLVVFINGKFKLCNFSSVTLIIIMPGRLAL
jgi:hypothetical protein